MKHVIMFETSWCPHCRRAHSLLDDLYHENPAYKDIKIQYIDEELHPDVANSYDYFYVPTFYVDSDKIHEGVPSKEALKQVLDSALA
ncbi:thioredoxin family protein [Anaerocolumna chitinilytica]|uniref:Thioredoxin domain-containing protein n=1 Tax=Anaerocolumna chitinilytica TaxID=1727145 RepID=A0A7I8DHJ5_9FIRM|nr:thioredoxin family protein [Anaerocolumna chitinilytica]BCJ97802.1 hypothetical protein bsdcttw_08430 [Anaerocolumna chitinilytica]